MHAYWILPNREQSDDIFASDGETIRPLREILDPKLRPEGLSLGVPTELLEKCGPGAFADILFAQRFPGDNGAGQVVSVSSTAGLDSSGRVIHIGLLFVLEADERPRFELSYLGLCEADKVYASTLNRRLRSAGVDDSWAQSVRDLIELPSAVGGASNVALDRSVVPLRSLYVLGPGGLTKKVASRLRWLRTAIVLLIVFAIAGVWCSVRAASGSVGQERPSDAAGRLGLE
jgi:hypothetical protein